MQTCLSTPTRPRSTGALAKGMGALSLESPLTDVSVNVRGRSSPVRYGGAAGRGKDKPCSMLNKKEKEDLGPPGGLADLDARGVVSKDWDGPELNPTRKRTTTMLSVGGPRNAHGAVTDSTQRGDRYIPNRELAKGSGAPSSQPLLEDGAGEHLSSLADGASGSGVAGSGVLDVDGSCGAAAAALEDACNVELGQRILSFSAAPPASSAHRDVRSRYHAAKANKPPLPSSLLSAGRRRIATTPERVLDAPAIVPDFYFNLLHWSSQNVIAIALQSAVHMWNSETGEASFLMDLEEESERVGGGGLVNSLRWDADGNILSVGTDRGFTQIWDVNKGVRLRTLRPGIGGGADSAGVNALAWAPDGTLNTGFASGLIREHDVRQRDSITRSLDKAHSAQVCGLSWRQDSALLASGGNDNVVKVWDRRTSVAKMRKENHRAAVKALAWCPHNSSILATGGGSADRCIHFWNTTQNTRVQTIQTSSQVTSLQWAPHYRELVSSHGVSSSESNEGALCVWSHPSCQKVAEIPAAHDGRVLHTSLSPDGQTLATVGSDESLKFWRVFEQPPELAKGAKAGVALGAGAYRGGLAARSAAPRSLR